MNDLYWEYMGLERCIECDKEIQVGQKMILIYENIWGKYWVHDGECWSKYLKSLTDPEEGRRGTIIGLCEHCMKPVRDGDGFVVSRIEGPGSDFSVFETTIPKKEAIGFVHKKCSDDT